MNLNIPNVRGLHCSPFSRLIKIHTRQSKSDTHGNWFAHAKYVIVSSRITWENDVIRCKACFRHFTKVEAWVANKAAKVLAKFLKLASDVLDYTLYSTVGSVATVWWNHSYTPDGSGTFLTDDVEGEADTKSKPVSKRQWLLMKHHLDVAADVVIAVKLTHISTIL